jgi:hypothetical protein
MAAIALVILQDLLLTVLVAATTFGALIAFASQLVVIKERDGVEVLALVPDAVETVEARDAQVG